MEELEGKFEPMTMVVCETDDYNYCGFKKDWHYLCIGEIKNMVGHYAFVNGKGKVCAGLHGDYFRVKTDED
jgi:hypothetical protein